MSKELTPRARPDSDLVVGLQLCKNTLVYQRRGIALALAAAGDVAEKRKHDLARASLGERVGEPPNTRVGWSQYGG